MPVGKPSDNEERGPTLLELVLQLHSDFRRSLEPIRVTPLQAGLMLYLQRWPDARLSAAATALGVAPPTLVEVVQDLVIKRWITRRPSVEDRRAVCLRLTRQGEGRVRQITERVSQLETTQLKMDQVALSITRQGKAV